MNSAIKNIITKITSFALIAFMGLLLANKGIYTHTHKLINGYVYTHAHPYNKTTDAQPYKTHHHTKAQISFFNSLNILFFSAFFVAISIPVIKNKQALFEIKKRYLQLFIYSNFGRAPPVL